jgi:biotin carboxylase
MTKRVLIIDGYSTAPSLVAALNALGAECLHMRSVETPPTALGQRFTSKGYISDFGFLGSPKDVLPKLEETQVDAVVAGSELGVEFAEALAHLLGLPSNNPNSSIARRNKASMGDAVARAGLRSARHAYVTTEAEAFAFVEALGDWPVVIKPVDSAGSDGVHFCHCPEDIRFAMGKTLGRSNLLGLSNEGLLIQKFLNGRQFFFNTVSNNGTHVVTDGWERRTRDIPKYANVLEDWLLVDPSTQIISDCIAYCLRVLDALGIENGAAVTEVRLTGSGPVLVETGARLNGPTMEVGPYRAAGLDGTQATVWAESIVDPALFMTRSKEAPIYKLVKNAAISFFIFKNAGSITDNTGLSRLNDLPSWCATYRTLLAGEQVEKTIDTVGRGGFIYWVHPSIDVIKADLKRFRDYEERELLYSLETAKTLTLSNAG